MISSTPFRFKLSPRRTSIQMVSCSYITVPDHLKFSFFLNIALFTDKNSSISRQMPILPHMHQLFDITCPHLVKEQGQKSWEIYFSLLDYFRDPFLLQVVYINDKLHMVKWCEDK